MEPAARGIAGSQRQALAKRTQILGSTFQKLSWCWVPNLRPLKRACCSESVKHLPPLEIKHRDEVCKSTRTFRKFGLHFHVHNSFKLPKGYQMGLAIILSHFQKSHPLYKSRVAGEVTHTAISLHSVLCKIVSGFSKDKNFTEIFPTNKNVFKFYEPIPIPY